MKTKVTFEPEDFAGSGQLIINDSFPVGSDNYTYGITVAYKICYRVRVKKGNQILMVAMSDGMVGREFENKQDLCEYLNKDPDGFRPMSNHEINKIIVGHGSRFPK